MSDTWQTPTERVVKADAALDKVASKSKLGTRIKWVGVTLIATYLITLATWGQLWTIHHVNKASIQRGQQQAQIVGLQRDTVALLNSHTSELATVGKSLAILEKFPTEQQQSVATQQIVTCVVALLKGNIPVPSYCTIYYKP